MTCRRSFGRPRRLWNETCTRSGWGPWRANPLCRGRPRPDSGRCRHGDPDRLSAVAPHRPRQVRISVRRAHLASLIVRISAALRSRGGPARGHCVGHLDAKLEGSVVRPPSKAAPRYGRATAPLERLHLAVSTSHTTATVRIGNVHGAKSSPGVTTTVESFSGSRSA